jgi:hypothetical protein
MDSLHINSVDDKNTIEAFTICGKVQHNEKWQFSWVQVVLSSLKSHDVISFTGPFR